jgi:hypothetical protein
MPKTSKTFNPDEDIPEKLFQGSPFTVNIKLKLGKCLLLVFLLLFSYGSWDNY